MTCADKVLRAHPGTVGQTRSADQHVDGADQVVGGAEEATDGPRIGEVQVGGEHRGATGSKTGREILTDLGPAGAHQHQIPADGQPRRRRKCDGR